MHVRDELGASLKLPTSRRTVVKTGVKLAYAVPVVAATMKLSAQPTGAASGPGSPDPDCAGAVTCLGSQICGSDNDGACACATLTNGGGICRKRAADCGAAQGVPSVIQVPCDSNSECPSDRPYCVQGDSNCPAGCPADGKSGVCTARCGDR